MSEPTSEPARPRLFEPESIAIATFLGSPLAGAVLWALNEQRVGRPGKAVTALVVGVAALAVLMFLGQFLPPGASTGANVALVFAARQAGQAWMERARAEGLATEPSFESRGLAAGVGVLGLVLVLGGAFGWDLAFGPTSYPSIEVRSGAHLYYTDVSRDEAERAARALRETGLFEGDHDMDVLFSPTSSGHAVSLVISEDTYDAQNLGPDLHQLAQAVQPTIDPNGHTEVRACDDAWAAHHTLSAPP